MNHEHHAIMPTISDLPELPLLHDLHGTPHQRFTVYRLFHLGVAALPENIAHHISGDMRIVVWLCEYVVYLPSTLVVFFLLSYTTSLESTLEGKVTIIF